MFHFHYRNLLLPSGHAFTYVCIPYGASVSTHLCDGRSENTQLKQIKSGYAPDILGLNMRAFH